MGTNTQTNQTIKILSIQFMLFIFLVVVLDIVLWMFFPVSLSLDTQDSEYFVTQNLPGVKKSIVYRSGKYGARSQSKISDVKPDNSLRILCLGASTTDQATQETQDTWCGILETKIRAYYKNLDLNFQALAFGRGGLRAVDDIFWLQERFDKIQPDIVITLLGVNDLAWNGGKDYKYVSIEEALAKKRPVIEDPNKEVGYFARISHAVKYGCKKYSQICRKIVIINKNNQLKERLKAGDVIEWHSSNLPKLREEYKELPYVTSLLRAPDPINEFRDAMNWLVTFFKSKEVPVILLGQPVLWQASPGASEYNSLWFSVETPTGKVRPSGAWLLKEMSQYNHIQQSLALENGMNYINLDDSIPKTSAYYFDDCHFTDLGSAQVATNVLPVVINITDEIIQKRWPN